MIKDLFYSTRKTIYEIYNEAKLGQMVDYEGFRRVVCEYSNNQIGEADIKAVFNYVARNKKEMTY
jgi:hypothetical protein